MKKSADIFQFIWKYIFGQKSRSSRWKKNNMALTLENKHRIKYISDIFLRRVISCYNTVHYIVFRWTLFHFLFWLLIYQIQKRTWKMGHVRKKKKGNLKEEMESKIVESNSNSRPVCCVSPLLEEAQIHHFFPQLLVSSIGWALQT